MERTRRKRREMKKRRAMTKTKGGGTRGRSSEGAGDVHDALSLLDALLLPLRLHPPPPPAPPASPRSPPPPDFSTSSTCSFLPSFPPFLLLSPCTPVVPLWPTSTPQPPSALPPPHPRPLLPTLAPLSSVQSSLPCGELKICGGGGDWATHKFQQTGMLFSWWFPFCSAGSLHW